MLFAGEACGAVGVGVVCAPAGILATTSLNGPDSADPATSAEAGGFGGRGWSIFVGLSSATKTGAAASFGTGIRSGLLGAARSTSDLSLEGGAGLNCGNAFAVSC